MHLLVVWVNYSTFSISDDGHVIKQNLWKTDSRSPFFANNERFGFKDPNETKQLSQAVSLSCCFILIFICKDGNAIGTAGAIAPPQKDESILVGTTLTMETILCLIKAS